MAVGDTINGISAVGTIMTLQPAVNVNVCITSIGLNLQNEKWALYDGVLSSDQRGISHLLIQGWQGLKFFINNTNYLWIVALPSGSSSYTGIQTK